MSFKLGIVATHPIQYQAPWFRALASNPRLDVEVLFGHRTTPEEQAAAGFGVKFEWDTPLLEGYRHRFLPNVAPRPNADRFLGIDTPEIGDVITREKYDAVLLSCGWYVKGAWQAMRACWKMSTPVLARGDSHLRTPRSPFRKAVKAMAYRRLIPRFDACLYASQWSREYFQHYGARNERLFFVPHALDEERFAAELAARGAERPAIRAEWGLNPPATVYLFSGKFVPNKRPLDFIRAVARAAQKAPVQGLMVGDGPMRQECEALVREIGAPVRFSGFLNQSQIVRSYVAADVLALPSEAETWGLVAHEAMFCSRPCLVSDQAGCGPDLVVPGVTGDIFACGDIQALANSMAAYAEGNRATAMGEAAHKHVAKYSLRQAVNGIVEALEAVSDVRSVCPERAAAGWNR